MAKVAPKPKVTKKVVKAVKIPAKKAIKKTSSQKRYFTLGEDLVISNSLAADKTVPKSKIAQQLSEKLGRTFEAVRDRIKRYHEKLSASDKASLLKEGKKNPNFYVYFVTNGEKGSKKIEMFSANPPVLQHRFISRKPRTSKKTPKAPKKTDMKTFEDKTEWIKTRLDDKDPYFQLDFSVQLLSDIFTLLIKEFGVSLADVKDYVKKTVTSVTLESLLNHFNIKPKSKK